MILLSGRCAFAFGLAWSAGATFAGSVRGAVALELFEAQIAVAVFVDFLEHLLGFFGILFGAGAGFEFLQADGATAIGIELFEDFFRGGMTFAGRLRTFRSVLGAGERGGDSHCTDDVQV